jgi:hypothetical protein
VTPQLVTQPQGNHVVIDSPRFVSAVGHLGQRTVTADSATLEFGAWGSGFASLTWVPTDGKTLKTSSRSLITLVARTENLGMEWNADRTSVSDKWGKGPVRAEIVPCTITLKVPKAQIYQLDPAGKRIGKVAVEKVAGGVRFKVGDSTKSCYFEVVK